MRHAAESKRMPYLHVVDEPRVMEGKGAPRQTVFGVLGHTKDDSEMKTLGGLVQNTKSAPIPKGEVIENPKKLMTERHITGPAAKTHISGEHYGQIPYPGRYMGDAGERL